MMRLAARIVTPLVVLIAMLLPAGVATAAPAGILRGHELSTDINACNGELIELEGDFQFLTHDELNGLNVTHLTLHAAGIGDQGNRYILNVTEHFTTDTDRLLTQRRQLVSNGPAPNQQVVIVLDFNTGDIFIEADCTG